MTWPQHRHGELLQLSQNVWRVAAPVPGTLMKRQMVVARDLAGRLLLHSAVALDGKRLPHLEALGTVTWLAVPNGHHRLDAAAYRARFPSLIVIAPSGAIPRIQEVVCVDLAYDEFPAHEMLRFHAPPWPSPKEGALEIRDGRRALLVFGDLILNPVGSGSAEWVYRWLGQGLQVPWLAKRMFVRDVAELRGWLLQLADTEGLDALIPGHGEPITVDAPAALRKIAAAI